MAQRDRRAKQRIKSSAFLFRLPPTGRGQSGCAVLHALYLIFNEGYASSVGLDLQQRIDLSN